MSDGSVYYNGPYDGRIGVRPAFYLNLASYAAKSGSGSGTETDPYIAGSAGEITAETSTALTEYIADDNKATGFTATITNTKSSEEVVESVTWTITPDGGEGVEIPVDLSVTLTLESDASAVIGIVLDGLYDDKATAELEL